MALKGSKYQSLAVIGSRLPENKYTKDEYENISQIVFKILNRFYDKYKPSLFCSGGAQGLDSIASNWAETKSCLSRYIIRPDWDNLGKGAGMIRNKLIIEKGDFIIAFTNGSRGTANSIQHAKDMKKPLVVFDLEGKLVEQNNIN